MTYRFKTKKAFTLVEVLISISILAGLILALNRIYFNISTRTKITQEQGLVQTDLNYFLRLLTSNIRTADKSDGYNCEIAPGKFFEVHPSLSNITFLKEGECIKIYRQESITGRGELVFKDHVVSSEKVDILDLKFLVEDDLNTGQPLLSVLVIAAPLENPDHKIKVQTSISLNYY